MKSPDHHTKRRAHVQRTSDWLSNMEKQQPQIGEENLQYENENLENQTGIIKIKKKSGRNNTMHGVEDN